MRGFPLVCGFGVGLFKVVDAYFIYYNMDSCV